MESDRFEEVEHTADWALRVRGEDLPALLRNAAEGMLHISEARSAAQGGKFAGVSIEAEDQEDLLVRWLEELLFRMETRYVSFTEISVRVRANRSLTARFREVPLAHLGRQIKAVTYHGLRIERSPGGLEATVIFDV